MVWLSPGMYHTQCTARSSIVFLRLVDSENEVLLEPDDGKDPKKDDIFIFNKINDTCFDDDVMFAYCDFLKRYTLKVRGIKMINKFMCDHRGKKSIFELITASDEAYAIFIFMNGYIYWKVRRGGHT